MPCTDRSRPGTRGWALVTDADGMLPDRFCQNPGIHGNFEPFQLPFCRGHSRLCTVESHGQPSAHHRNRSSRNLCIRISYLVLSGTARMRMTRGAAVLSHTEAAIRDA